MKIINKTKFAIGTSLIAGLTAGCAGNNPFAQEDLASGYQNAAETSAEHSIEKMKSGACGEGKCGGKMTQKAKTEAKKAMEGKCGDKMTQKAKTEAKKAMEGKCGEGKCGGSK